MVRGQRIKYYLILAALFYMLWFLFKLGGMPDFKQALLSTAIDVIISFGALWLTVEVLLPEYIHHQKYRAFSIWFLLLVLASGSVIILSQLKLMGNSVFSYKKNLEKYQEHFFYWFWSDLIFGSYFLVAFISFVGCSVRMVFEKALAGKKMEALAREKAESDLLVLKHQLDPHFLFNALNTAYYKIDKSNTGGRKILEQFSSLLRYQLYECNAAEVPIKNEIGFIANYIDMQRERLNGDLSIQIKGFADVDGFSIAPYLLVPIVENCFKHLSQDGPKNQHIVIECGNSENWFWFRTVNSFSSKNVNKEGGIGLINIRKRLAILYQDKHVFQVEQKDDLFAVTLKVQHE
jgi:two-component system LytT family sensor kinase